MTNMWAHNVFCLPRDGYIENKGGRLSAMPLREGYVDSNTTCVFGSLRLVYTF